MQDTDTTRATEAAEAVAADAIELADVREACRILGGSKPINPATLYRGIAAGLYPKPIRVARGASRWIVSELRAAIRARIAERDSKAA